MNYKLLGRTGVQVSNLCFGTMSFGGDADADESARMYKYCLGGVLNHLSQITVAASCSMDR